MRLGREEVIVGWGGRGAAVGRSGEGVWGRRRGRWRKGQIVWVRVCGCASAGVGGEGV